MGDHYGTSSNVYPKGAVKCLAGPIGGGSVREASRRFTKCQCDLGSKSHCEIYSKIYSGDAKTTSPSRKQTTTTRAPTTTRTTTTTRVPTTTRITTTTRTTTTVRPWTSHPTTRHQLETTTTWNAAHYVPRGVDRAPPEAGFSMVQVLGWASFATLVIVAIGAVFKWIYRKRQRQQSSAGQRPQITERGEPTSGFAEPSGAEASSAQFQPSAPMLPTGGLPSDLPPPYDLVAYPKPPPYESVEKDTKWASAAGCSECDAKECTAPDHASGRPTAKDDSNV